VNIVKGARRRGGQERGTSGCLKREETRGKQGSNAGPEL
jgi:hypothetical protein